MLPPLFPTDINLLHFRTPALDVTRVNAFRAKLEDSSLLEHDYSQVFEFSERLFEERQKRLSRIQHEEGELLREFNNLLSSRNISDVYLKMREAFHDLSFESFFAGFKKSLKIMLKVSEIHGLTNDQIDTIETLKYILQRTNINNQTQIKTLHVIDEELKTLPQQFNKNLQVWEDFLLHPNNFLNGFAPQTIATRRRPKGNTFFAVHNIAINPLHTTPTGIPDWFSEDLGNEPSTENVKEELEEDKNGIEKNTLQVKVNELEKQKERVISLHFSKFHKAVKWAEDKRAKIFAGARDFPTIVLFLHLIKTAPSNQIRKIAQESEIEFEKDSIFANETSVQIENEIKAYSQSQAILGSPEIYAIFLERQFRNAEVCSSIKDQISPNFVEFIFQNQDAEKSKTVRDAIKYGIKPLLSILDPEEIDYVKEFAKTSSGINVEYFIWELSELLAGKFKKFPALKSDESKRKVLGEVRKFAATFLRKNWQWAFDSLKEELMEVEKGKSIKLAHEEKPLQQNGHKENENTSIGITEINEAISELKHNNLSGWKLLYSTNKSTDLDHLIEIAGETLEEKEQSLKELAIKRGLPHSIKTSSILNVFDWLVTIPKEVEQIRIRKTIQGEEFKKIKRGSIRIFYVMDEAKKQIIFFLHQKKAWRYGF